MSPEHPPLAETGFDAHLEPAQASESHAQQLHGTSDSEHGYAHDGRLPPEVNACHGHDRGPDHAEAQDTQNQEQDGNESMFRNRELKPEHIRDIVRLFQCRHCSKPFRGAITLPCGRSICKTCVPETHVQASITYPAAPDRLQGFLCPFEDCSKVHALIDCGHDVILNKVSELIEGEIQRGKVAALGLELATSIGFRNPWGIAGISSLQDNDAALRIVEGGRLVATWSLATEGGLAFETEVIYTDMPAKIAHGNPIDSDTKSLRFLQSAARAEMDCQVCYALFHDPVTTGCGHTFCRPCLHRTLDHSYRCPMCRRTLAINPLLNSELCPSNECVGRLIELFWPEEKLAREEAVTAEISARHDDLDLPLFVCTLSFPAMPTFLHVFEPRYRLMIRRALEGNRTFGMVLPKRPRDRRDQHFHSLGTLLRVVNAQFYPDGRSVIETVGLTRFRVIRHGELDGYTVAKTERIDDVSLEEEGAMEAAEVAARPRSQQSSSADDHSHSDVRMHTQNNQNNNPDGVGDPEQGSDDDELPRPQPAPTTVSDLRLMSTQSLMRYATDFVAKMGSQSVPWLTAHALSIYGDCPNDPAIFPWWFASMLPVKDLEKYRLLATSSVRERLKICCMWIIEWESTRWLVLQDMLSQDSSLSCLLRA
ncbi:hypothetical protein QQS21_009793 [Conoideocrella luteorostrata]|uniref:ATP-dependent protease La domain-containing protein n=1 Tax=Conoideocrella luteorostrata TaxID=1105319 RepID=A0AAJ0CIL8_9HYPO|nr:hypothetical protein QQS21_009793 [Conoideocrella luteorostrata]